MVIKSFVISSLILFFGLFNRESNYIQIPLEFSSEIPILRIGIEGKSIPLLLDLGSACEFELSKEVLNAVAKKERVDTRTVTELDGRIKTSPTYLLQRVQIRNGEAIHTIASEADHIFPSFALGRIGRNILQTSNLLLDFQRSLLFVLRNFEDLGFEGYKISDFHEVPFEMTRWGAVFSVETDFGIKRCFINTSDVCSSIRDSKTQNRRISTTKFKIGDVDLGNTELNEANIDLIFDDIDGYLGIDFFMKTVVFLDYQNRKALISRKPPLSRMNQIRALFF
jgi:hypothetical protein